MWSFFIFNAADDAHHRQDVCQHLHLDVRQDEFHHHLNDYLLDSTHLHQAALLLDGYDQDVALLDVHRHDH